MSPSAPVLDAPPSPADFTHTLQQHRGLWALPLWLSVLFVVGVVVWLRSDEIKEREVQRQALITDALSLQAQLEVGLDAERVQLQSLADAVDRIRSPSRAAQSFVHEPRLIDGLSRVWRSVVWLDATGRFVAQAPEGPLPRGGWGSAARGDLSIHLAVPLQRGGSLVVRLDPGAMLRREVPWWLARRYDVRLIDGEDNVIASTAEPTRATDRAWYRVRMGAQLDDTWLELTSRDRVVPWWRTLPLWLALGFLALIGGATWMLRRQVHSVRRAEDRWREEAAWRRAMEDSLTVGLRARDLEGRLIYANRGFADLVGYEPEELVGLLPPMPYWAPDQLEATMWRHRRNMAGQAPREGYEARWRTRDGRDVDVLVFEAPLVDARGRHVGWMASVVNQTERKRLEESERRQTEAFAHQARLTMLGEIASTLAHELNQPLMAISSYNTGVMNSLQRRGVDDAMVLGALQRLGEQAALAGRIVRRIREFLTRRQPRHERVDLHALIDDVIVLLRRELERHSVTLELQLHALPAVVRADRVLIEQVLINLIRNACDAMMDPSVAQREVAVHTRSAGRFVRVSVSDRGTGLQGRRIDALCAPFFSTKAEGMGMGLAICRSILEAHQGGLDAKDRPDGGACFAFTLPVWEASDTADAAEAMPIDDLSEERTAE